MAAHQDGPTDPWASDLPPAGWETSRHGNHHQPGFDDDEDCWDTQTPDEDPELWSEESPVDDADLAWYARERDQHGAEPATEAADEVVVAAENQRHAECRADWPVAYRRPRWRALTATELEACRPTVILHVHLTDQTLRAGHGVVRSPDGPITVEQLRRLPRPDRREHHGAAGDRSRRDGVRGCVRDPAAVTAGDDDPAAPVGVPALTGHRPDGPGPHPTLAIGRATGSDRAGQSRPADSVRAPGQDRRPLEGPTTRTGHLPVAITRGLDRHHHQPRHPHARTHRLGPEPLERRS